jgi:hypothetical protein
MKIAQRSGNPEQKNVTQWNTALQKLVVVQLIKKFSPFMETENLVTYFITTCH